MFALKNRAADRSGFSLAEMLMTCAVIGIVAAMALPGIRDEIDRLKLGMATRAVQSELQTARLKAVSSNTYMRVRFDCPAAGQFRAVERIGTPFAADAGDDLDVNAATRCNQTSYPFKATGTDSSRLTRPNNDGPVKYLTDPVTFSTAAGVTSTPSKVLEFWPDGSVHVSGGPPWPRLGAPTTIVLVKGTTTQTITVTSLGNIQMQR
jgi:prepilin-type N-terminal cleavage/methylation domain-containing protein